MNIYILTEGGSNIGLGHISRCSSIYQAFKERGYDPKFIVNTDENVNNEDYIVSNWIEDNDFLENADIVIIDSYLADKTLFDEFTSKVPLMVFLDDNKRINYSKGIVVNGTVLASNLNYPSKHDLIYFLGSEYIPLREEFWQNNDIQIKDKIETILITLGGNDLRNLTPGILDLLSKNFSDLNKKVIIGNSFSNKEEIEKAADDKTELIYGPDASGMLNAMLNSDIAVSASGQTLYELACTGLPTIAIGVIDNQVNNIENWQEQGFIYYAGCWNNPDLFDNIIKGIENIDRYESHFKGISAVDGQGSRRIVKHILNQYIRNNSVFREIKNEDCLKIFEIANDDEVRESSFNSDKIDLKNHKIWFENILKDDSTKFFVLEFENDIVGQIRFDFDEEYPVISISLNKKYRGLSLSKFLFSKGLEVIGEDIVLAYIKSENKRSIGFFESIGFEFEEECIIKGNDALKFVYRG